MVMSKTLISIKVDTKIKHAAKKLAGELGLPLSTIVNAHLKRFVAEKEIRFALPLRMSKKLEKIISETEKDFRTGRNLSPKFDSGEEMDKYLASV